MAADGAVGLPEGYVVESLPEGYEIESIPNSGKSVTRGQMVASEAQRRQRTGQRALSPTQALTGDIAAVGHLPQFLAGTNRLVRSMASPFTGEDISFFGDYAFEGDVIRSQIDKHRAERGFWGALAYELTALGLVAPGRAAATVAEAPGYFGWMMSAMKWGAGYGCVYGAGVTPGDGAWYDPAAWEDKFRSGLDHAHGGAVAAPIVATGIERIVATPRLVRGAIDTYRSTISPHPG